MCIFADRYFLFFSLQFFNVYFCSSLCAYSLTGYEPKIISTSNLFSANSSLEVLVEDHLRSSLEAEKPRKLFPCFVFVTRSRKTHKARTRVRQSLEAERLSYKIYWCVLLEAEKHILFISLCGYSKQKNLASYFLVLCSSLEAEKLTKQGPVFVSHSKQKL